MKNLFLVSHTHWDREWYLPFQGFRMRLVKLIDKLLTIFERDPDYRYFTLDGQTIVLEDYLEIRPEREGELRRLVEEGKLLIGPWYVLADEFLVSPEALIRNLIFGDRIGKHFGAKMIVGYTPDPFGHISQLPQILAGFGIHSAVLKRGLSDEPTEVLWKAPDGTSVLLVNLREGYDNAARLPLNDENALLETINRIEEKLAPHSTTSNFLLMNGTDHMEPQPELPRAMKRANERMEDARLIHATLPMYIEAVRLAEPNLQIIKGELRSPKRHHLLSGVLSARIRIKQRNNRCETLLEKWAEPFSKFANLQSPDFYLHPLIRQAWRYLLQNHPHDSICGCSIDQVHKEMDVRFDWVEQIGEEVTKESLEAIAKNVNTALWKETSEEKGFYLPVVVFNPAAGPRTDIVTASVQTAEDFIVLDGEGREIPYQILGRREEEITSLDLDKEGLLGMLTFVEGGRILDMAVKEVQIEVEGGTAYINIALAKHYEPDLELVESSMERVMALLDNEAIRRYKVRIRHLTSTDFAFVAEEVPGYGYKTYRVVRGKLREPLLPLATCNSQFAIRNEFFAIEVDSSDGTLTIEDKATGMVFEGMNRFVNGGDRGDEYNYCVPEDDLIIESPSSPPIIEIIERGPIRQTIEVRMKYHLPEALAEDRRSRSDKMVEVPIRSRISIYKGVRRIDFSTVVENRAKDHRLRVHFPTQIESDCSWAEGSFDVIRRQIGIPIDTAEWIEQPTPTHPQRTFVDVNDGEKGLMVINKGLPEYEVIKEKGQLTIALTLLRCVGWLSRDDLTSRRGHAGPGVETPEAQCLGVYTFDYAILPHLGDWREAFREAHAFNAQLRAVPTDVHTGTLPPELSFVELEPESLVISAIKAAEEGDGLIVRFYNIGDDDVEGRLRLYRQFHKAALVNMKEEEIEVLGEDDKEIALEVRGKQIVTLRFEF